MTLAPGTRIGAYEIVSVIGAGGMGEVYRARDTRLERTVAIKALAADKIADDERKVTGRLEPGGTPGLIAIDVRTGEKRRVTNPPAQQTDIGGAFSPDGGQLTFLRLSSGNPQGNIYVQDLDPSLQPNGEPRPITTDGSQLGPPVWTADGGDLLFPSNRAGRSGLWRIRASGGTPVRVPLAGTDPRQPAVRGSRLAYVQLIADTNMGDADLGDGKPREDCEFDPPGSDPELFPRRQANRVLLRSEWQLGDLGGRHRMGRVPRS